MGLPRGVRFFLGFVLAYMLLSDGVAAQGGAEKPTSVCPKDCPPKPDRKVTNQLQSDAGASSVGWRLRPAECLVPPNGKYSFCFEADGNVVLYNSEEKPLWESKSGGRDSRLLDVMAFKENSGRLVVEDLVVKDIWVNMKEGAAETEAPFTAEMKDDGNFVITTAKGRVLWATNTTVTAPEEPPPAPAPSTPSPVLVPAEALHQSKKPSTAMIAGIAAAVVMGLVAIGGGAWFLMKRKKAAQQLGNQGPAQKMAGSVAPIKADVEMGGALDQSAGAPGRLARL